MNGVERVCAHAQALAQCAGWLNQHWPSLERQPVASNAEAARMASQDETTAAIAGESAARHHNVQMVAAQIQDDTHNRTRFAVLGAQSKQPTDAFGARQDVADPFGAQQSGRRISYAVATCRARRVDDSLRVTAGARGYLGVLLLRRRRGTRGRAQGRTGA